MNGIDFRTLAARGSVCNGLVLAFLSGGDVDVGPVTRNTFVSKTRPSLSRSYFENFLVLANLGQTCKGDS